MDRRTDTSAAEDASLNAPEIAWFRTVHKGMFTKFDTWFQGAATKTMRMKDVDGVFHRGTKHDGALSDEFFVWKEQLLLSVTQILTFSPRDVKVIEAVQLGVEMKADRVYKHFVLLWVRFLAATREPRKLVDTMSLLRVDLWGNWGDDGELDCDDASTSKAALRVADLHSNGIWDPFGSGFSLGDKEFSCIRKRFDDSIVGIAIGTQYNRALAAMNFSREMMEDSIYAMYAAEFVMAVLGAVEKNTLEAAGVHVDDRTVSVLRAIMKGILDTATQRVKDEQAKRDAEAAARLQLETEAARLKLESEEQLLQQARARSVYHEEDASSLFDSMYADVDDIPDDAGYNVFLGLVMGKLVRAPTVAERSCHNSLKHFPVSIRNIAFPERTRTEFKALNQGR
jgi:hypothetical protein